MALFDKISRAVTETGQKTLAKAKELADTSRLNALISEEEKKITNLYYQIGKLYVSIHGEDHEEEFVGMIKEIADTETKINDGKRQIQELKGVQRCEKCGAEVPKGSAFCSACGSPMPKIETVDSSDYVKCGNCGAMVKKGMRFCTSCGKPLGTTPPDEPISVTESATAEAETVATEVVERVCPNCGTKADDDSAFCTECGTKL